MAFKTFRKIASKAKKIVRKGARAYLKARRSKYVKPYSKSGMVSTTAIAKTLSNLKAQVRSVAEYKSVNEAHTTGSPDTTLRQFYRICASATQATVGNTTTPGTVGYFLQQITYPTRGDGLTNFDGKRFHVGSIQWKGVCYATGGGDVSARLYIIQYDDEDMDAFQMYQFLLADNNSEYSIASRRNPDFAKNYKVIASRTLKMATGNSRRRDFNIVVRPNKLVKINEADDTIYSHRYFCMIIGSTDLGSQNNNVDYQGHTRLRFVA